MIAASALAIPAVVDLTTRFLTRALGVVLGVEASLASQSLSASLRRTSVLVGALSTAIAMMTAVGVMVGSFRETVQLWMNDQVPADLYVRAAGVPAADRHPSLTSALADKIAAPARCCCNRPAARLRNQLRRHARRSRVGRTRHAAHISQSEFSLRTATGDVLSELRDANTVVVSEPFANKHNVRRGDSITLSLSGGKAAFRIVDVYYDYSSERGTMVMDRATALKYLPDPAPSNLAVYLSPGASLTEVRQEIEDAAGEHRILIFSNRDLRTQALVIFDRTFAITYALEAVAVIVAVIGVAGALLAVVIDRRRELGLLRFLGRGCKSGSQADRGGGRAARLARDVCGRGARAHVVADFDFRDQQAIVWMDNPISLAGRGAGRRTQCRLHRDGACGIVSGECCGAPESDRGCA